MIIKTYFQIYHCPYKLNMAVKQLDKCINNQFLINTVFTLTLPSLVKYKTILLKRKISIFQVTKHYKTHAYKILTKTASVFDRWRCSQCLQKLYVLFEEIQQNTRICFWRLK